MEGNRIGVYICWCGTNIAKTVDVEKVAEEMKKLDGVVISKSYQYMCSDPGQEMIVNDIKEHQLKRIVVAACSPRIHELTFRKTMENAGLNPYMFQMANIREQVSWVHSNREFATQKAIELVKGAIYRVRLHEPLERRSVEVDPATLVVGGGIAGITAALTIADAGKKVYLVEKSNNLGGQIANVDLLFPKLEQASQVIQTKINRIMEHPEVEIFLNTKVEKISGFIGNFETYLNHGINKKIKFGNIVLATGLKPFMPTSVPSYGYGRLPDVITSLEFEKMLLNGKIRTNDGLEPKHLAIIHCVGSRNSYTHEYCSRSCCSTALKYIHQISSALPEAFIYDVYADMRSFGKGCEELYTSASTNNVAFLMFNQENELPTILTSKPGEGHKLTIKFKEKLSGELISVPADLVILMVGMEAQEDAKLTSQIFGISVDKNRFYMEKHPKLDPVATTTDGIYVVGACQSPKGVIDCVSQARAASARVLASIAKKTVDVEVTTASVTEEVCCGCQTCISVCPYTAISSLQDKSVSFVNEVLCKGCGTCSSACPTGAIHSKHFSYKQILSQITGIMSKN
ncbi:MAG: CoB--CoM heterodisulfide reductase iron-sulfur subunit A family protein [Bacteroidetes bacterium]|nr:CoB--CoM heterodisulfide reductase iron-sulfur subunit A family protein [Bacteroidota bacterium]